MEWVIVAAVIWVICGILNSGLVFAYFQRKWPTLAKDNYDEDRNDAWEEMIFGPIALAVTISMGHHKYGFKYK